MIFNIKSVSLLIVFTALFAPTEALTGPRGMGMPLNDLSQQNIRRYAPQNWQDTLEILNSGSNPGSLSELQGSYTQKHNMFQHIEGSDVSAAPRIQNKY